MANSQSLTLMPPQPAAAPDSTQSIKKIAKPSSDQSFGQKLDKAKKQIATKTSDSTPEATPVKTPPAPDANAETPDPTADASDPQATPTPVDPTTQKPVAKAPKPVAADPAQDTTTDPQDPTVATKVDVETQTVKAASPTKPAVEKPKKAGKVAEAKVASPKIEQAQNSVGVKPVDVKAQTEVAAPANDNTAAKVETTDAAQTASKSAPANATAGDGSDHSAVAANNQLFGSGTVIAKGNPGDNASSVVDSVTNSANQSATDGATSQLDPVAAAASEIAPAEDAASEKTSPAASSHASVSTTDVAGLSTSATPHAPNALAGKSVNATHDASPQVRFAEDNHPKIVTSIAGQLLPKGGTMQLQLNPADLGALQVTVHIQDGVVTASFETSNDDATKLLSHSLGQLKQGLEAAGVSVEKLHVERAPQQDSKNDSESDSRQPMQEQQKQAQQDQQRREMVQRMWRRLAGGADPLDLVA